MTTAVILAVALCAGPQEIAEFAVAPAVVKQVAATARNRVH